MFTFLFAYFGIALLALAADGMVSFAVGRKFKFGYSFIGSLFWPLVLPVVVWSAWQRARDFPEVTSRVLDARASSEANSDAQEAQH